MGLSSLSTSHRPPCLKSALEQGRLCEKTLPASAGPIRVNNCLPLQGQAWVYPVSNSRALYYSFVIISKGLQQLPRTKAVQTIILNFVLLLILPTNNKSLLMNE